MINMLRSRSRHSDGKLVVAAIGIALFVPFAVQAQEPCTGNTDCGDNEVCLEAVCTAREQIDERVKEISAPRQNQKKPSGIAGLEELDPIKTTPEKFIGRVIKGALGFVGTIALVMIVYAGVTWMLAGVRGNATDIKKAQETIFWSVVGLAVIFSSYALVHFIVQNIAP